MVSVVIPAYNEEKTVGNVVRLARRHPLVREVIVVDDGSSDSTAKVAQACEAQVIKTFFNAGKAAAMSLGVTQSTESVILFLDADIDGLTEAAISQIIEPVVSGRCSMFIGVRQRPSELSNVITRSLPLIGGERAVTRQLWEIVPRQYKQRFQIEIALNYFAKHKAAGMGFAFIDGISHVSKEKKRGFWLGLWDRLRMIGDIVTAFCKLYIFRLAK